MEKLIRIGVDTSKSVFQLHGVNAAEEPVLRKQLRRGHFLEWFGKLEPTVIGMDACGASHHWARELEALGHKVVLLPPQYVKAYVVRGKNDKIDAEAICEAMSRPKIRNRFVAVKSAEQQAAQMLTGTRDALMRRRTQLSNAIRGYAAEFGLVVPKGLANLKPLLARILQSREVPPLAKEMFALRAAEYDHLGGQLRQVEKTLLAFHRNDEAGRRLAAVPGIGPIGATLLSVKVSDAKAFASGRNFAAWVGLTPRDHTTAGRFKTGGITRAGDEALRSTLVQGATAIIDQVLRGNPRHASPWIVELIKRKPRKLAAVALANKTARIAWKLMVSGERYDRGKAQGIAIDLKEAA